MTDRCSRCHEEPRAGTNRWGRVCLAAQARARRAARAAVVREELRQIAPDAMLSLDPPPPANETEEAVERLVKLFEDVAARVAQVETILGEYGARLAVLEKRLASRPPLRSVKVEGSQWQHGLQCQCVRCRAGDSRARE